MIQPEKTSKYAVVVSLLTLCFIACNGKASEISNHSSNPIVTIERFDKGLPSYAQETDTAKIFLFIDKYTPFFRSIVDTYSVWEMLHRSKRD